MESTINSQQPDYRRTPVAIRRFLLIYPTVVILIALLAISVYNQQRTIVEKNLSSHGQNALDLGIQLLGSETQAIIDDIQLLALNPEIEEFLEEGLEHQRLLTEEYLVAFLEYYKRYDQVRIIDLSGDSIMHAKYSDGKGTLVKSSDSSNQAELDQRYHAQALDLKAGEVYMSSLKIDPESSAPDTDSISYHPILYITPITDRQNQPQALLIADLSTSLLMSTFRKIMGGSRVPSACCSIKTGHT